jgi:His/Glu/Gln/Arg/opine family amino acid ABC transporter permease subunit
MDFGYTLIWTPVIEAIPRLSAGILVTLEIALVSSTAATALGLIGALLMRYGGRGGRVFGIAYLELMRNSPSLVKMYFLYFGLATFGIYLTPFVAGTAALSLHNAAYMMEIFRAAITAVSDGQREAAASLGLGRRVAFIKIIWPQALRRALPALGNNWAEIVKDTSITSALSLQEFYFVFTSIIALNMRTYEFFIVGAAVYLVMTGSVAGLVRLLERRLGSAERQSTP